MILDKIELSGIKLAVVEEGLQITGEITNQQLDYLKSHKPTLIATLRLREIAEERNHPLDDLLRWYKDDLQDLAAMSDEDLRFVVCEYLDNLDRYKPANRPHTVRCIDCKHFVRKGNHSHLGKCAAGTLQTAPAGFWDTHLRGCDMFIEFTQARPSA